MFLKRIVLHGFKSFADRTELEFGPGITAVVGPNGCGKSNVLDAVRWVLGEQSARSLRGGRMSDVVFAGSRSRSPANFAEVALTFDNHAGILRSDLEEVIVGRILYRSGESEYRLNGNPCRLKDVKELLLDTGVGVDAYSVIEQGRVDLLLQANPLERREIFEEAAGISRYKARRSDAQRRLERTQGNLVRLQDILEELEKRLRSVRLAAGKARNYQQYDARLRELRSSFAMAEYHELEQTRAQTQREIDARTAQLGEERVRLADRDAEAAEVEHLRQQLDDQIQTAEGELLASQTALSALTERITQGEQRVPELIALRQRREAQAEELAAKLAGHQERLAGDERALAELQAAEVQAGVQMAAAETALQAAQQRAAEARESLERERVAVFETVRRATLLQNEQENHRQQQLRLRAQFDRVAARLGAIQDERRGLDGQFAELGQRVAGLELQSSELAQSVHAAVERLTALTTTAEQLDHEISAAKETRTALTSRQTLLEDLEHRLEGVDEGTRAVLAWRDDPTAPDVVVGLAADVLRIDDPRVALLQPILATFESSVVVRDTPAFVDEVARQGGSPDALRVVLLDRFGGAATRVSYAHAPGFVACAADWVSCAPEFRPLAEHLLGRTFVVETLEQALRLAFDALAGCVFVTLTGETVGADGRLTYGAVGTSTGLISRKAEIRQLQAERDEWETRLVHLTRRRMELDADVSDMQLQREGLLQRIATVQREHADARHERTRVEETRQRLEREAQLVGDDARNLERGLAELDADLQALETESAQIGADQRFREERTAALAAALAETEGVAAQQAQACTAAAVERGRAAEKGRAAADALREIQTQSAALEHERAGALRESVEMADQVAELEQALRASRAQLGQEAAHCEQRRGETLRLRECRQELRQRIEECGAASRELQRRLAEWEGALHERQVAVRESEVRKEALAVRVREELALDLAELYRTYQHAEQDWETIRAEIEDLRGKIARLGNVNLDALVELDELTPRYEHLAAQRADLVEASARLEALIAELDQESRARFAVSFEEIRGHFQEMYRKLFGGGKADILLEDPEHPLECGIEIIARPPGKEPQSISLLSGGEKTLTAVALLMAVFMSRPSPFAILDEVDAALDESNVERFNNVLQEFLTRTQFVVITHSKRTMACADVLYGVTMEEPGVSKRVSVRFDERVRTPNVA